MSSMESLPELYQAYKQSTKYVIAWLSSAFYSDISAGSPKMLRSTAELINAAKKVREQKRPVPTSVIHFLLDAIKRRRQVSQMYKFLRESESLKSHVDSDINHETFIIQLEEILKLLLPLRECRPISPNHTPAPELDRIELSSNRFAVLRDIDAVSVSDQSKEVVNLPDSIGQIITSDTSTESFLWQKQSDNDFLQDDDIGEWIELCFFLQELDAILIFLDRAWTEAAKDEITIPMAAWLSTTAFHAVGRICKRVTHIAPTYDDLVKKWLSHRHKGMRLRFIAHPELSSQSGDSFVDGDALWRVGQSIINCRARDTHHEMSPSALTRVDPRSLIARPAIHAGSSNENLELDSAALIDMQESMRQLLDSKRGIASLELSEQDHHISEPLLPVFKKALEDNSGPIHTPLVFGMQMLLSSYKAFTWPHGGLNKNNCRITALRFAQEVRQAMSFAMTTIAAIETPYTTDRLTLHGYRLLLEKQKEGLDEFRLERRFDLYYQAPWTAGGHIVEILGVAFSTGLALSCEVGYVCAVLHLYNALRRVSRPIEKIALLDELCQLFLRPLFMGDLPPDNFCTRFRRAMGQPREKNPQHGQGWPSRLTQPALDLKRSVSPSRESLFYELHATYYRPTIDFWVRAYLGRNIRHPSQAQIHDVREELHSFAFNIPLERIKNAIVHEFKGPRPLMRINLFRVFVFCTKILRELGEKVHDAPQIMSRGDGSTLGYAYVDAILGYIVEHQNDEVGVKLMPFWEELNMTKSVFEKIDTNLSLSDFLWSI